MRRTATSRMRRSKGERSHWHDFSATHQQRRLSWPVTPQPPSRSKRCAPGFLCRRRHGAGDQAGNPGNTIWCHWCAGNKADAGELESLQTAGGVWCRRPNPAAAMSRLGRTGGEGRPLESGDEVTRREICCPAAFKRCRHVGTRLHALSFSDSGHPRHRWSNSHHPRPGSGRRARASRRLRTGNLLSQRSQRGTERFWTSGSLPVPLVNSLWVNVVDVQRLPSAFLS